MSTCRMCGGEGRVWLKLNPTPIANSFPTEPDEGAARYVLELQECLQCSHVQLHHQIPVNWSDYRYSTPEAMRPHLAYCADDLRRRYPKAKTVLEIGSNVGMLVEELRKQGFQAKGIDPSSPDGVRAMFLDGLAWAPDAVEMADMIVAHHVLAHVDDLQSVFRLIDRLLKPEGVLVFEVQYFPNLVDRGSFDLVYHEHRDYHTLKPWPDFLKKFGLIISGFQLFPEIHGGSVRVFCERPGLASPVFDEQIDWRDFDRRVTATRQRIWETVSDIDGPVAAFGASAKACTLIHQCGLQGKIAYCVDETPAKQGRYLPGTAIPIVPLSHLEAHPPAALLVTAWNYADLIAARFPQYKLIVPFTPMEVPV